MDRKSVIEKTESFVREKLEGETTGHDWFHVDRVRKLALFIGDKEGADLFVVELAALLHDIADWKFSSNKEASSVNLSAEWLRKLNVDKDVISHICQILEDMDFKGAKVPINIHEFFEEYKSAKGTAINHFYEKLLLLKSLFHTKTAKDIALHRHEVMENFLNEFFREWEGKDYV